MTRTSAGTGNPHELLKRVAFNLRTRCRVPLRARLLVAVSGGSDSVALLRLLKELAAEHDLQLTVAHFDHRLRRDSNGDAHFVVDLAAQLGLEVCVGAWERPQPSENAAREARHSFLNAMARRHRCDAIALAHQLEDQVETVLMRLGRGTGPRGLVGIPWRRRGDVDLVRPLLDCRRALLTSYLRNIEQSWRDDPTNADRTRLRNRVRHGMLPVLEHTFGAQSLEGWADSLEDLRMLLEFVNASAVVLLENIRRRSPLDERGAIELGDLERLRAAPRAVCAAALIQWLESVGCTDLRRQHIRGAVDLVQNGQSGHHVVVPGGARVGLEQDSVVVTAANGAHRQAGAAKPYLETSEPSTDPIAAAPPNPSGAQGPARQRSARLVVEVADRAPDRVTLMRDSTRVTAPDVLPDELVAWIDLDAAAPQPTWSLRTPQRGDRVRLLGAPGARKLARILQDARVPRRLRNRWPVLADPAGILWVPGIGVAERVRLHPDTRHAARLVLRSGADAPSTSPPGAAAVRVAPETPAADQARTAPRTPPATPTVVRKPAPREDQRPADWGG